MILGVVATTGSNSRGVDHRIVDMTTVIYLYGLQKTVIALSLIS